MGHFGPPARRLWSCANIEPVSSQGGEQEEPAREAQIQLPPEMVGGVWANFAVVRHSPYEFTLDFARMEFSEPMTGMVVARVNLSPLLVTQLMNALQENWNQYAQKAMPREVYDDGAEGGDPQPEREP